jgi:rhodanese-related sulfurtransferase
MKKIINFAIYPLMGFLIFNLFFRNMAQADGIKAYELVTVGKAVMVDVREKDEIKDGIIKGAQWLPLSALKANPTLSINKLKNLMKNKELYIYCRSGARANTFLAQIKDDGIQGLNLGGYNDLVSKGLPSQIP